MSAAQIYYFRAAPRLLFFCFSSQKTSLKLQKRVNYFVSLFKISKTTISRCLWDQEKMKSGYTYVEGPQMRRRRAYMFMPDYKYA